MKLLKKYCLYALSFCMAAVMMLVPIQAEAAYGTISNYDLFLYSNSPISFDLLIDNVSMNPSVDINENGSSVVTYKGTTTLSFWLNNFTEKRIYDGKLSIPFNYTINNYYDLKDSSSMNILFDYDDEHDNIYTNIRIDNNTLDTGNGFINVVYDYVTPYNLGSGNSFTTDIKVDFSATCVFANDIDYPSYLTLSLILDTNNATSDIKVYTDYRDIAGYDGFIADQNQQIIDGIQDNTTAVDSAKNGIVSAINSAKDSIITTINNFKAGIDTQFSHLFNNMQAWYDGLTNTINDGIDRLINNYSGTGTTDAANKFDDSAGHLEQVESDLTTITNSSIGSYTESAFDTSVITSLGSSLVYVVTWFTNFWNMGGLFTSILNVGLALSVAFFILRLRGGS